jgi:hypothetical protein
MDTPAFAKSRDERKKVEMRFAHLKTHHRFERIEWGADGQVVAAYATYLT